ncbi:hypothetical protein CkaCkLH20_06293 [Colletotrichum karsti]|uniref:Uncharacterized protein n=1 Tax=Colletotrichum karsti TaxID=1095194 RepID=A0A9P6I5S2_9PEZI|nr:uncharacterized protein CkaCkLH20_06293 [Colletotrichum karsti]KAF9876350.1 hypothetical protein CkaCkLH20_06293 [Colletotrichum karsti]
MSGIKRKAELIAEDIQDCIVVATSTLYPAGSSTTNGKTSRPSTRRAVSSDDFKTKISVQGILLKRHFTRASLKAPGIATKESTRWCLKQPQNTDKSPREAHDFSLLNYEKENLFVQNAVSDNNDDGTDDEDRGSVSMNPSSDHDNGTAMALPASSPLNNVPVSAQSSRHRPKTDSTGRLVPKVLSSYMRSDGKMVLRLNMDEVNRLKADALWC